MDNSSILISIIIVLCIAAGVTAYGLTNDSNAVFNDLSGFTPDAQGNTGIGNNSTNGTEGTGVAGTGASSGTGGTGSASTGTSSSSSSGSSSGSSGSTVKHNISPERAKQIAANAAWSGAWCYSVKYNSGGYYTCLLKDDKGNTGYALVGSGTGRILEGSWNKEVTGGSSSSSDSSSSSSSSSSSNKTNSTNSTG